MEFHEIMSWLVKEQFITFHKGKPIFTPKAHKQLQVTTIVPFKTDVPPPPPPPTASVVLSKTSTAGDWTRGYQNFIVECNIPDRCFGPSGDPYSINKYSEEGMKAFKKAISEGYQYDILKLTVTLYYKDTVRMKKAIGNYMSSGEWRTDYDRLLLEHSKGNIKQHLNNETNNVKKSRNSFGRIKLSALPELGHMANTTKEPLHIPSPPGSTGC